MIDNDNQMRVFALCTGFAIIGFVQPAIAAQFDGHWRMVAVTTSGHCGEIPIDVGISRGRIYSTGGSSFGTAFADYPIQLVGRVSTSGQVRMNAVAGPRSASGTGRFNRVQGNGTWSGTGPSGICLWRLDPYSPLTLVPSMPQNGCAKGNRRVLFWARRRGMANLTRVPTKTRKYRRY